MVRKARRPTAVTVFAILQLIFGGLGLLCDGLGVINVALLQALSSRPITPAQAADPAMLDLMVAAKYPVYLPMKMVLTGLSLLVVLLMLLSGIGLLLLQKWGRWMVFAFAILTTLVSIPDALLEAICRYPAVDALATNIALTTPSRSAEATGMRLGEMVRIAYLLVSIPYAGLMCFFLTGTHIRDAFAGVTRRVDEDDEEDDRGRYARGRNRDRDRFEPDRDEDRERGRYDRDRDQEDRDRGYQRERDPEDRY